MQYQSFPGVKGDSSSLDKLAALRLPSLQGKRVLDVGCNEGFFCGYAVFDSASKVVGMDKSPISIERARLRFPEAEFHNQSWDTLPKGPFDVIILLSALHYADDQADLIHRLMAQLSDDGLLVLEISMAPGSKDEWVKVKRSIDERYFPTRVKLGTVLNDYAWKVIGHSVNQAGDPLQRYVIHVRKLKPYAWLLLQQPGSGKTTISRHLFNQKSKIPMVSGDRIYYRIVHGQIAVSDELKNAISTDFTTGTIDKAAARVFENGLASELVALWAGQAGFCNFAIDSYVPEKYHALVKQELEALGYFPVDVSWDSHARITNANVASSKALEYRNHLTKKLAEVTAECILIKRIMKKEPEASLRWHLDSPVHGEWLPGRSKLKVAGWALGQDQLQSDYQVYVRHAGECLLFSPDRQRGDVLISLFGSEEQAPAFWKEKNCGFVFELPSDWLTDGFELGLVINDQQIPLARLRAGQPSSLKPGWRARLAKRIKKLRS